MSRSALVLASTLAMLACRPEPSVHCIESSPSPIAQGPAGFGRALDAAGGIEQTAVLEGAMPSDIGVPPRPGELRFIDSNPHVPFFAIDPDHGLVQPRDACLRWGVIGSRWWALDPWGTVVGEYELYGGDGYLVTNCYELEFSRISGELGTGLLVTGPYREVAPARWQPSGKQLVQLELRVAEIDAIFPTPNARPSPLPERMLAYQRGDWTGDDGRQPGSREWVAVGGRWLGLFSLEADGDWRLRYLDSRMATDNFLPANAQHPLAAVDLDADGDPELIIHESWGPAWNDALLRPAGAGYERGFESPGGATI